MFTITEFSRSTQRVACMLLSVGIVAVSLMAGVYGMDAAAHPGYTVTITQVL